MVNGPSLYLGCICWTHARPHLSVCVCLGVYAHRAITSQVICYLCVSTARAQHVLEVCVRLGVKTVFAREVEIWLCSRYAHAINSQIQTNPNTFSASGQHKTTPAQASCADIFVHLTRVICTVRVSRGRLSDMTREH